MRSRRLTYLLTVILWASPLLHIQLLAGDTKVEGLIFEKGIDELLVLEVDSYETISIPITDSTKIKRKNHKGITFDDLRRGWFVEIKQKIEKNGNLTTKEVKVKVDRLKKVKLDAFLEGLEIEGVLVIDGQSVITKKAKIKRKKNFSGPLTPGLKTKVKGIRLDDGSVEAREIEVEPNEIGRLEKSLLKGNAEAFLKLNKKPELLEASDLQQYIERIGQKLIPAVVQETVDFEFHVIQEPTINAFAGRSFSILEAGTVGEKDEEADEEEKEDVPLISEDRTQGSIYVHTGLLKVLENEAQLATVLGHEIAHVTHEHLIRRATKHMWTSLIFAAAGAAAGGVGGVGGALGEIGLGMAGSAILNGYGRDFEDQADRVGLRYLYEAGYDPMEAPKVWDIFSKESGDQDKVTNFFYGSHSTHSARKRNLFQEISQSYFDEVNCKYDCGLMVNEEDYKINVLDRLEKLEEQAKQEAEAAEKQRREEMAEQGIYTLDSGVTMPHILKQTTPSYTDEAIDNKVQGIVILQAVIRKNGRVNSFKVLRGLGYGLEEMAIQEISKNWRFGPGTLEGKPVDVLATIEVQFKLK